ncbi:MAG: MBL fold metallo-hydrolase [Bacilli bacterium]|nr:MBL fold metallo-hydrolase [Bacilli bacterium]
MKVQFLGTGSISSLSASASIIINDEIVIDMGNGVYKRLLNEKIDITKIKYLVITHLHGDHCFDLPFFLLGLSKIKGGSKKITIIAENKLKRKIKKLLKMAFPYSYRKILRELSITYINNKKLNNFNLSKELNISSFKVFHGNMTNAHGYILDNNKTKLLVSGDTSYCNIIKEYLNICDYAILDSSLSKGNESHMGVDNIEHISKIYKNTKIYSTHMSPNSKEKLKKIEENNINLFIPEDGNIINI